MCVDYGEGQWGTEVYSDIYYHRPYTKNIRSMHSI